MMKGALGRVSKNTNTQLDFIRRSTNEGRPSNLIIVLDTHSDTFTGQLQVSGGLTGVSTTLTLPDLVKGYVGVDTLEEMASASEAARNSSLVLEVSPGVTPWGNITPKVRGGWRVLIMVSCGSAVKIPMHWEYITHLFQK